MSGSRSAAFVVLSAVLAACGGTRAASSAVPEASRNPATRPDDYAARGPFVWEVQGDGGASTLFGTIHAGVDALPPGVAERLSASHRFIMEADLRTIDADEVVRLSTLPDGKTLDSILAPSTWDAVVKIVGHRVPADTLRRSKPWFVQVAILQALYPTGVALDAQLLAQAEAEGKELVFLEDWRFQLQLLDAIADAQDIAHLVDPASRSRKMLEKMMAAYRTGDFVALTEAAFDPELVAADPNDYQRLFDDRNRAWVSHLEKPLREGRAFVAVGVGHLAGEQGLVELLRARGFIVRRVEN